LEKRRPGRVEKEGIAKDRGRTVEKVVVWGKILG